MLTVTPVSAKFWGFSGVEIADEVCEVYPESCPVVFAALVAAFKGIFAGDDGLSRFRAATASTSSDESIMEIAIADEAVVCLRVWRIVETALI